MAEDQRQQLESASSGNSASSALSAEKMALIDFCYRLGSCHGTVSADTDDRSTRQEAELLMSLLESSPYDLEPISSSESEHSFDSSSDASSSSNSGKRQFRFTCPSLSLESLEYSSSSSSRPQRVGRAVSEEEASSLRPATLLGRTLQVDDRDALRLSADAMAINVKQSFQKAIQWRIDAWIHSCSKVLVQKEQEMRKQGAGPDDLKELLQTNEAVLIVILRQVAEKIQVTSTTTSFQVMAPCEPKDDQEESPPQHKKQRTLQDPADLEEGEYKYKVSHVLMMEVVASLSTPAGFSEINLQVPGMIEGTFLSPETGMEELRSVVIELDTEMLSAMVEKSCRTLVRSSVEAVCKAQDDAEINTTAEEEVTKHATETPVMKTPSRSVRKSSDQAEDVRSAIVTPRALFSSSTHDSTNDDATSPKPVLFPIPDNLDESTTSMSDPRRISPHPNSPTSGNGHHHPHHHNQFLPRTPMPSSTDSPGEYTPQRKRHSPPLISPSLNESSVTYAEEKDSSANSSNKGPSLPVLVAVACREMHTK